MSVPRPAMLVAIVTVPGRPACAMIIASRSCCFAFSTACAIPDCFRWPGEVLGRLDRGRADEHRLAALHAVADVLDDRVELVVLVQVDEVRHVLADHRPVRRHDHDLEAVDLLEFEGLGVGRAGHAGELAVEAEVVLEGDGRDGLVFLADPHAFLGLDRLVQAVRPAPARHRAAGELVDDDDVRAAHDVLDVLLVEDVRAQRRVQVVHQADARRVVEALAFAQESGLLHQLLGLLEARFGQVDLARLLVGVEIALAFLGLLAPEARHERVDLHVELGALLGGARDDERRAGLVDQDRVHLVHDREMLAALHAVLEPGREVVAQVVEAELVVGAVSDVAGVGRALVRRRLAARDDADREAEQPVDRAHPLRVALREVLVDRDDVRALAGERVQVHGQRRDERLALARAHLGDLAVVQHHAADQLHVEGTQADGAARRFAGRRKGLGQDVVERLAGDEARAQAVGALAKAGVARRGELGGELVRLAHALRVLPQQPLVTAAEYSGEDVQHAPGTSGRRDANTRRPGRKTGSLLRQGAGTFVRGRAQRRTNDSGFIGRPSRSTSKCTCGPVERPVEPISATGSPRFTVCPGVTRIFALCA